jgi:hypothetical protein
MSRTPPPYTAAIYEAFIVPWVTQVNDGEPNLLWYLAVYFLQLWLFVYSAQVATIPIRTFRGAVSGLVSLLKLYQMFRLQISDCRYCSLGLYVQRGKLLSSTGFGYLVARE